MNDHPNLKSHGWDMVGGLFWKMGRVSARPSKTEIDILLGGINHGERCVIVGASTKELIEEAIRRGIKITVIDFSNTMCNDLRRDIGQLSDRCEIICHDILGPVPNELKNSEKYVLADRLINRFTLNDAIVFFNNALTMLKNEGEIRTSVKLGFYEMDNILIEEGKKRGTLTNFFDPASNTIDFAAATDELRVSLLPHGSIPSDILLKWYYFRGKETRFNDDDIKQLFHVANSEGKKFSKISSQLFSDSPSTVLYRSTAISSKMK